MNDVEGLDGHLDPAVTVPEFDHEVFVVDEQTDLDVDLARAAELARFVLSEERVRRDAELSLSFVDEVVMADLHLRFLGLEGATDVLAFPMDEFVESGRQPDQGGRGPGTAPEGDELPVVIGDVVVCPAVARRQAEDDGSPVGSVVDHLVVHGILHLLGYDHVEAEDAVRMRRREREILETARPAEY